MLFKIILKNFKSNIKNYLLFFISEMITTGLLLALLIIRESCISGIQDEATRYLTNAQFVIACVAMMTIAVMLMFFSVRYYMKVRSRDYAMFLTLGIRKNLFYQIVVIEYFVGWLIAIAFGLLLGQVVAIGTQEIFKKIDNTFVIYRQVNIELYGLVTLISLCVVLLSFAAMLASLQGQDMSLALNAEEMKEPRPKSEKWYLIVIIGIALYIFGCYRLIYMTSPELHIAMAVISWIAAGMIILGAGTGPLLEKIKSYERLYYRKILQINQYYHRYINNTFFVSMMFIVHFLIIGYMACAITEELPLRDDKSRYPYDYVWFGQESDERAMGEMTADEGGEMTSYPMIRITSFTSTEDIGISESTYREITGDTLQLENDEVCYIIESDPEYGEEEISIGDYKMMLSGTHTGKYRDDLTEYASYKKHFAKFYNKYQVKKCVKRQMWGKLAIDDYRENTLVLSDERFVEERAEILEKSDEMNELFLINIPEENQERFSEVLSKYVEEYGVDIFYNGRLHQRILYDINQIIDENFLRRLFIVATQVFIIVSFCVIAGFCVAMKIFSDIPLYKKKYEFLNCMGMREREQRKNLKKEIKNTMVIPLIAAVFFGITYFVSDIKCLDLPVSQQLPFAKNWFVIFVIYLFAQFIFQNILVHLLAGKITMNEAV